MSQPDDTTPENTTEKKLTWEFPEDKPFTHNHPERPGKSNREERQELPGVSSARSRILAAIAPARVATTGNPCISASARLMP